MEIKKKKSKENPQKLKITIIRIQRKQINK